MAGRKARTNTARKTRNARSFERGEARRKARQDRQQEAHRANKKSLADGEATPWQLSRQRRLQRRAEHRKKSPQ